MFALEPALIALGAAIVIAVWARLGSRHRVSPVVPLSAAALPWMVGSAMSAINAAHLCAPPRGSLSVIAAFHGVVAPRLVGAAASAALAGCLAAAATWKAHASGANHARGLGVGLALSGVFLSVALVVLYARSPTWLAALLSATGLIWVLVLGHAARATSESGPQVATLVVTATGAASLQAWTAMPLVGQCTALAIYSALGRMEPGARQAALASSVDALAMGLATGVLAAMVITLAATTLGIRISRGIPGARRALWIGAAVLTVAVFVDIATTLVARATIAAIDPPIAALVVP